MRHKKKPFQSRFMNYSRLLISGILSTLIIANVYGQTEIRKNKVCDLKIKDYRPKSIYNIPKTNVCKAKFPAIDIHSHDNFITDEEIAQEVGFMDSCGIEKTVIFGGIGKKFDSILQKYSKYANRFEVWCGFDFTGYDKPGYGPDAVKELERCFKLGAKGVGEIMFKGKGIPPSSINRSLMLPDDERLDLLFEKCAELGMPVNLHIAEDKWMYEKIDSTNDGLMNASLWNITSENGSKSHEEMMVAMENTLKKHPKTIFIAAHLLNCNYNFSILANLFNNYPNLYADISARFGEFAPVPKYTGEFMEKYQDRLLYGTDNRPAISMYRVTFRILETNDEHFYEIDLFGYHWPLYGLALKDEVLKKIYRGNALRIMEQ